jgi:hypothetical protein
MGIQVSSFERGHQGRNSSRFIAHRQSLAVFQRFVQRTRGELGTARLTWEQRLMCCFGRAVPERRSEDLN